MTRHPPFRHPPSHLELPIRGGYLQVRLRANRARAQTHRPVLYVRPLGCGTGELPRAACRMPLPRRANWQTYMSGPHTHQCEVSSAVSLTETRETVCATTGKPVLRNGASRLWRNVPVLRDGASSPRAECIATAEPSLNRFLGRCPPSSSCARRL